MKILLYADLDISLPGGLETHLRELAPALTARGHQVDLYARPVPFGPLHTVATFDPASYDVIHHHGNTWPPALDVGERYVRTLHFCVAAKMDAYVRLGRLRTLVNPANWRARREEGEAIRPSGRFIAVSTRVRDEFARFHGLDPARAVVIPNGVRLGAPSDGREAWRERHHIPSDVPVLLTVGRRDFVKGHALLERAWRRLPSGMDALWIRVGDDAPDQQPGIWTTGPVAHEDVREWIAAADVGALPSHYEGCSVALLEMIAGGLYSLAHDVGGAAEGIGSRSGNGEIVAPRVDAWVSALTQALATPHRPRTQGLGPEYRWDQIAARTEAVYEAARADSSEARSPERSLGTR
jgi:glycosyltransferase involved in cell wall biosynthesis